MTMINTVDDFRILVSNMEKACVAICKASDGLGEEDCIVCYMHKGTFRFEAATRDENRMMVTYRSEGDCVSKTEERTCVTEVLL